MCPRRCATVMAQEMNRKIEGANEKILVPIACLWRQERRERAIDCCSRLWERDVLAYSTECESVMSVVKKMKKLLNQPV